MTYPHSAFVCPFAQWTYIPSFGALRQGPEGHVPTQYEKKLEALQLDKQPNPEQEGREVSAVALAALGIIGPLAAIAFLRAMRARK